MSLVSEETLDGKHARRAGTSKEECQSPPGTHAYVDWRRGWEFEDRYIRNRGARCAAQGDRPNERHDEAD